MVRDQIKAAVGDRFDPGQADCRQPLEWGASRELGDGVDRLGFPARKAQPTVGELSEGLGLEPVLTASGESTVDVWVPRSREEDVELKHNFVVPSSLEDTWHSFNQLEDIAPCFPGAALTSASGDQFTGTVKVKLGPIAMMYAGTGEFLERNEDSHTVVIAATGKDKRGNGTAGATVTAC